MAVQEVSRLDPGAVLVIEQDVRVRMVTLVAAALPGGDFVPSALAGEIAEAHPELLREWAEATAVRSLTELILAMQRRRLLRLRKRPAAFGAAARDFEAGDADALDPFRSVTYTIDEQGTRRHLGDMRRADHLFVARSYDRAGNTALMLATFHRAVAKRLGVRTTAEAMAEEEYEALLGRFSGQAERVLERTKGAKA